MTVHEYYHRHAVDGRAFLPRSDAKYAPFYWIAKGKDGYTLCSSACGSTRPITGSQSVEALTPALKIERVERPRHHSYLTH